MLPDEYFERHDDSPDEQFYIYPRKVVHIDEGAIAALWNVYAQWLPPGGAYLDLMSSWRSHLPDTLKPERVTGLGMNAEEMADNPQLDDYAVQNLNRNPVLPYADDEFDAAMCAVSVQYLTQPVAVFREVRRVLKPGAPFVVSFSNRCFPTKAVAVWVKSSDRQHLALVTRYFELAGGWQDLAAEMVQGRHDPLYIVRARRSE